MLSLFKYRITVAFFRVRQFTRCIQLLGFSITACLASNSQSLNCYDNILTNIFQLAAF